MREGWVTGGKTENRDYIFNIEQTGIEGFPNLRPCHSMVSQYMSLFVLSPSPHCTVNIIGFSWKKTVPISLFVSCSHEILL